MAKIFEALKKADEKLGPVSEALLKTPEGQKVAERVDELRKKAEAISSDLDKGDLKSLASAAEGVNELMQTPEAAEGMSIIKKLHLKGVMKTAEFFHSHPKILKGVRKTWDSLPDLAKDGLLASRFVSIPGYSAVGKVLNNAAHLGLIERSEEDLAAMAKNENVAANGAVALGMALGVGEVVAPAAEAAKAYDKMAYENYAQARKHLKRLESEDATKAAQHKSYEKLKATDSSDSAAHVAAVKKKLAGGKGNSRMEASN